MKNLCIPILFSVLMSSCNSPKTDKMEYPITKKGDAKDVYFGTEVKDPYRWLEDDRSVETSVWVENQNKITDAYLEKIPFREKIRKRLNTVWNYEKVSVPFKKGERYFFYKNNGLQNQSVLYVQANLNDTPVVLLDPNTLSEDGTVALAGISVSKDGKYLAYRIARAGSDWNEVFVKNIDTGKNISDHLKWLKFTSVVWLNNGFYYGRYDKPLDGKELSATNEFHKIYYHKLGDSQDDDKLIFEDEKFPKRMYSVDVSEDNKYLILSAMSASHGNALYFKKLSNKNTTFTLIVEDFEFSHSVIDNIGTKLLVLTNNGAPRYRLVEIDLDNPKKENWKNIIAQGEDVFSSVKLVADKIVVNYMKDAYSKVSVYNIDGRFDYNISLPGIGTASSMSGDKDENIAFYSYESYNTPDVSYKYDFKTKKSEIFYKPKTNFNCDDFIVEQKTFKSKDGTSVPMFIVHKKDIVLDGNNPCLLYGYGGFNISLTPSFHARRLPFLENGGVYVVANLRGGGEYGEAWHKAGTKLNKQNVFDDCIAAAEFLIKEKYTNKDKLILKGGSNGGLLVGAVINQRPDLFRVAIPEVGVMDMLRYHQFTIGWAWAGDYGTSKDSKEMFEYLYSYSPVHNVSSEANYPSIMVATADHDDRVVPAHSFKYIANLQEKYKGENPVLIRIESNAGHGAGMPTSKQIDEYTDFWSFIFYNINVKY